MISEDDLRAGISERLDVFLRVPVPERKRQSLVDGSTPHGRLINDLVDLAFRLAQESS